ncbi:4'-phosphopantetheinyl transferase superfamily protein [Phaeovibrio sulfidiphilus]|uniref:4'-phosphopantetheinyl transferase superfamily protein n=1 Tax=Phaeovibrio sulfidiphilus TaxID=1220600 RepID=A0A8J6YNH8_9PROT|nr:4'-phosphopantetheinyl transferase superfamily protein [Phaeovibrio sulfidiphilus]MBE1236172.1 4'-phosphopantetheinyl transferase superfamily protein [Phaeovibrio sulfidiphilus]
MTGRPVWLWTLSPPENPGDDLPALMDRLDAPTRARVLELSDPRDRWARAGAHALLRSLLSQRLGGDPHAWQLAVRPGGKPVLPGHTLDFSLSHTRSLCACALLEGPGAVGLDLEPRDRPVRALALARRFFHPLETRELEALAGPDRSRAFLDLWTAKEAVVKAAGGGIQEGLASFRLRLQLRPSPGQEPEPGPRPDPHPDPAPHRHADPDTCGPARASTPRPSPGLHASHPFPPPHTDPACPPKTPPNSPLPADGTGILLAGPERFEPLSDWTLLHPPVPGFSAAVAVRRAGPPAVVIHRHFDSARALPDLARSPGPLPDPAGSSRGADTPQVP